ncbi:MAG: membrane protein insertase YidC, partial [Candidatus Mariimomonas ferrooxydans]
LSEKDPYYVLPIAMGLSMVLQQKMTPSGMDPKQAKIMMLMPIVFTFMFLTFPSGLVLYWVISNLLSIIQQYFVNKKTKSSAA